ncbi:MAG: transcription antitermination factor NusB [Coriobacteriia bacterium]|nr:transcription antitermination factor NusB [Coriobacteriia bacterium]MCL2536842.1 transcription antitermination factor NusB [Coriobacteriia bacterium]
MGLHLPKSHSRTFARYYALRLLYQLEMRECLLDEILDEGPQAIPQDQIEDCLHACDIRKSCEQYAFFDLFSTEPKGYSLDIVRGYEHNRGELNMMLDSVLDNWSLYRMPPVDRSIARLAAWEIVFNDAVPDSVAINEAVTLAKEFGGEDSSKFINGILGKIAHMKSERAQSGTDLSLNGDEELSADAEKGK